ncbi:2-aminoethylphosphonate ABC transporter substrate-binding protein [uncultured Roseburia sp.]|uniref:2-aminoethylphosphonate ABC transporter substrate-binding protein n=1 Tax=Brotonthovivens ammoniilytica TaxID=2981725 RepID=A0ABT2TIF6_9FIRM|nr:putative 2-aminoethylphosphonate ABC transporter substrate-binding protein [Brotonthovivens ammoniilytica]MCU6761417.1 putative 2-aminoethylphosphonate ABC transporter substrate-binding protein [Brotonthovivens ammoniilytica]SCI27842.1 2-aminoethylphosphonate ABC transporter substrate-binding protein [uncultured Roseburia sp.]
MKKMKTMKWAAAALSAVLAAGALTGCGVKNVNETGGSADTAETQDENTLNIYTALEDDQINDYLTEFKEKYPDVQINITRDSTGIITAKLLAEKDNPQADVVWGLSAASLLVLEDQDMLEPYAPEGVDRIQPEFKDSAETPKWVGIDAWETAFLVNKEVLASHGVTEIPESYADLTKPEYKGLIAMSNPASSGTGTLTVNGLLTLYGEEEGWNYLDKLHDNVAVYLHSGSAPAKDTAKGEYGIGISFGYRCIKSAEEMGDNGVVVFPEEGSGWDVEANCLIKKDGGEKEISKKFLDWAISDGVMEKYAQNYPIVATGVGDQIPEGYEKNPMDQLIKNVDLKWCAENRDRILNEWTNRYDGKSAAEE